MRITADTCVDDIMEGAPATIRVFIDYGMNCVGCPIAQFHSIGHACCEQGIDVEVFLQALREAVATSVAPA